MESVVDQRGRILIPKDIRERFGIREGSLVEIIEDVKGGAITIRPSAKVKPSKGKSGIIGFYGIGARVNKTGEPEPWPSPREIKSIWE